MSPTIKPGDALIVQNLENAQSQSLRVGDIIIYSNPELMTNIVHRVIKINSKGILTRGDNNNQCDDYYITPKALIGRVKAVKRGQKTIKLAQGRLGNYRQQLLLMGKYCRPYCLLLPRAIVQLVIKLQLLYPFQPLMKFKIIRIKRHNSIEEIMQYHNAVIGRRRDNSSTWQIKFPYKLFINPEKL
jgi:hypothetical protein